MYLSRKARLFLKVAKIDASRTLNKIVKSSFFQNCSTNHVAFEYNTIEILLGGETLAAGSGRLGQYNVLKTDSTLISHLLETMLFSKKAYDAFFEKQESFIIQAVFGPHEIVVSRKKQLIFIETITATTVFVTKEAAYNHLILYELTERYYVIRKVVKQKQSHFLVTAHRNSTDQWLLVKKTVHEESILGMITNFLSRQKTEAIAQLIAKKLGDSFRRCQTIVVEMAIDLTGQLWILDTQLHFQKSKWHQYNLLLTSEYLSPYVPNTDLLTKKTFEQFIRKYREVIIKPVAGEEGRGIVQITKRMDGTYLVHEGKKKFLEKNIAEVLRFIRENCLLKDSYLIQQYVPLAKVNDCPIDMRVIVQRVSGQWKSTGKIIKVASEHYFTTNAAQQLLPFEKGIQRSSVVNIRVEQLERKIDRICLIATKKFESINEELTLVGFDIGITDSGQLWIIEGNFNPNLSMFAMLTDKSIFMKILTYRRRGLGGY